MSGLAEIQHAILELPDEERFRLAEWLYAQENDESPELLSAIDEGIHSIEAEGGVPAEEVRRRIASWITK